MIRQALISTLLLSLSVQAQNTWQNYKDSLRKDESLLRFYTFENLKIFDDKMDKFLGENKVFSYNQGINILIFFNIKHMYVEIENLVA